jgi:hypothetical protein
MVTINLTQENYSKAIALGIYCILENVSNSKKIVRYYKACGRTEEVLVQLTN